MDMTAPFSHPLYVMAKPAGAQCNLRCSYCYYLEKHGLYGGGGMDMPDDILEEFTRQYIEAQTTPEVLFTWHGGEPLLRGIRFYEKALALQRRYGGGRRIDNCIQTNGTLITEDWCRFFKDNGFLVGVSIDGPQRFHDAMRGASFGRVVRGIELLVRHGVEWNAMAVVNSLNAGSPEEFYRFFRSLDCRYLQFTPIVERRGGASGGLLSGREAGGGLTPESVAPGQWGDFLCRLFDEWRREDVGVVSVQLFEAVLANLLGLPPFICVLGKECGHAAVMEHNGDVYSCDHFVFPDHYLGNIRRQTITEMMYSGRQADFGKAKRLLLTRQCRECRWLALCNGECPKNRFADDRYGAPGHNYLCEGYRRFFAHSAEFFEEQAGIFEGRHGGDADEAAPF